MDGWTEVHVERFLDAAHRAAGAGLVRASGGNLSQRLDGGAVAITATGAWLGDLTREQIALLRLEDGRPLGPAVPSVEAGFHLGVLRARPDLNAILHFQSPAATTIACGECAAAEAFACIPEVPYYVGEVAFVAYHNPGSPELAAAVVEAMGSHDLVILRNHGQVAGARGLREVLQMAEFLELACEIVWRAGGRVRTLPLEGIEALRARAGRARRI
ncbi:MAG: class II aldolase/adducin family protein [Planctomycetes bacterium]|nr:class II aldolase/adducin family protein [Planctomycetota bacterium]